MLLGFKDVYMADTPDTSCYIYMIHAKILQANYVVLASMINFIYLFIGKTDKKIYK
jgi:hypothetical protein